MLNRTEAEGPKARSKRTQLLGDAARAISLANLFFLGAWMPALDRSFNQRLKFTLFNFNNLAGLVLDIGLLALAFWIAASLARACRNSALRRAAKAAFLLVCVAMICLHVVSHNALIHAVGYFNPTELRVIAGIGIAGSTWVTKHPWRWLIGAAAGVALIWYSGDEYALAGLFLLLPSSLLLRWDRYLARAASTLLIVLFPFAALLLLQNFWLIYRLQEKTPLATISESSMLQRRAVWLIFDELDYHAAFGGKDPEVPLPEFTRLQEQSLVAADAYPPADSTMLSLPALITGRLVSHAKPIHSSELTLKFEDEAAYVPWSTQPNVFQRARDVGVNTALVGWYHPYKRIIGHTLNFCAVYDADTVSLPVSMLLNVDRAIERTFLKEQSMPLAGLLARWSRQRHIEAYVDSLEEARRLASDARFGLVLIHLAVPHPPGIYSREKAELEDSGESSYFDNLALADRTLGEIRRTMEAAGVWDSSLVLASSDHWWRPAIWQSLHVWTEEDNRFALPDGQLDYRVPFLLKMPFQSARVPYNRRFNTILSEGLILAFLRGELDGANGATRFLDQNARPLAPYLWDQSTD